MGNLEPQSSPEFLCLLEVQSELDDYVLKCP